MGRKALVAELPGFFVSLTPKYFCDAEVFLQKPIARS